MRSTIEVKSINRRNALLVKNFRCSEDYLDNYLKSKALYYDRIGEGKTFLVIDNQENRIIAYYTIKCSALKAFDEENSTEPMLIPSIEIINFAVDIRYQGKGNGKLIFESLIDYIIRLKKTKVGIRAIILFALPKVVDFYEKFNFTRTDDIMDVVMTSSLNKDCISMFTMLRT